MKLIYMTMAAFPLKRELSNQQMDDMIKIWGMTLSDIPYQLAESAIAKAISTAKFFPTLAEIREAAASFIPGPPLPELAWTEVLQKVNRYKDPDWSCPEIKNAVRAVGYLAICDSDKPGVQRAHFIDAYRAIVESEKDDRLNKRVLALTGASELLEDKAAMT